ncbi:glutamate receptor-like isoform X2 [Homarus americanus]|nr:glutamate receptor-like isoform X2 [Homarus americanus]
MSVVGPPIWLLLYGIVVLVGTFLNGHRAGAAPEPKDMVQGSVSAGLEATGSPAVPAAWLTALSTATELALVNLPEALRRTAGQVHLCFSDAPDEQFVGKVWSAGRTPMSVWTSLAWRVSLVHTSYKQGATHVLVGHTFWLLQSLILIQELVANKTLNIQKTQLLFVSTEGEDSDFNRILEANIPEKLNVLLLHVYQPLGDSHSHRRRRSISKENKEGYDVEKDKKDGDERPGDDQEKQKLTLVRDGVDSGVALVGEGRAILPGKMKPLKTTTDETRLDTNYNKQLTKKEGNMRVNYSNEEINLSLKHITKNVKDKLKEDEYLNCGVKIPERSWEIGRGVDQSGLGGTLVTASLREHTKTIVHRGPLRVTWETKTNEYHGSINRTIRQIDDRDIVSFSSIPQVGLHMAVTPGDGSVVLRKVGVWNKFSGLLLDGPLQATPSASFHGRDLILTTVHKPRVFEVKGPDGNVRSSLQDVDGYVVEVIRILERSLNFSAVITATNTFGSQLPNGSWNGMLGFLIRGEADLSPLDFSPSWARAQAVDFSEWFSTDGVIIVSQAPQPLQRPFLLLQIFSSWVWLSILVTGVLTGSLLWAMDYFLRHPGANRCNGGRGVTQQECQSTYQGVLAATLKLFVTQSSKTWCLSWSARVASSCLFLAVVSLVGIYQSYIIAFLAVPRRAAPIDSAIDLMERLDTVTPIVRKNTVYYHFVVNFESYSPIAANLKFHQDSFLNTWDFFQLIQQGKYALIDTYSSGVGRAAKFESQGSQCRFYISRQVLKADLDLMAHPQNSVFKEQIDLALQRLRSFGIIEKIKDNYYSTSCERELAIGNLDALSLNQVQSAFFVLAVGYIISLLGFISEIIYRFCGS